MVIQKVWFDGDQIYGQDEAGCVYSQSMLWYPRLKAATLEQRMEYSIGLDGIHWRSIDEDISFESFLYPDAEPTRLQHFFLTHPEINVSGFAQKFGFSASLMRSYINGFKTPSPEREQEIMHCIEKLGNEYLSIAS